MNVFFLSPAFDGGLVFVVVAVEVERALFFGPELSGTGPSLSKLTIELGPV